MRTEQKSDRTYLDEVSSDASDQKEQIFSSHFAVAQLNDPVSYLPKYQQNQIATTTCNEQCLSCCGDICVSCAMPFGCCGCSCCCMYQLPTSYGN